MAAAGGAFAQSTITGDIAYGFSSATVNQATTSGWGMEAADLYFNTSEDIEGVGKVAALLTLSSDGGRGSSAYAGDNRITLTTMSGSKWVMESAKGASYLAAGLASAGSAYETDLSGKLLSSRTYNDAISLTVPLMDGLAAKIEHAEADNVVTIGTGSSQAASTSEALQRMNTLSLTYTSGPLSANAGYRAYDNVTANSPTSANTKNRFAVAYDMGVAKIGVGMDQSNYAYGNTKTSSALGLTVPLGKLNIGGQFAQVATSGNSAAASNYTRTGSIFGGQYNLSKRTYAVAQYYSYDAGNTTYSNGYFVGLFNTF